MYVSVIRMEKDHPVLLRREKTLHRLGGAIKNPHWGKAWLIYFEFI